MEQKLIINVLGPLEVLVHGRRLFIRNHRLRTLLTALALTPGEPVSLAVLIDAVWPSAAPSTAMHQVRKALSSLREILPDGWESIRTTNTGYVILLEPAQSDLAGFRALVSRAQTEALRGHEHADTLSSALRLWRGLPGQGDLDVDSRFVTDATRQWRMALVDAVDALIGLDRAPEAAQSVERYEAIAGSDETIRNLKRRMGGAVVDEEQRFVPGSQGVAWRNALPPRDPHFSGRDRQIERITSYLNADDHNVSPVVLIHGSVGVGKSALAAEVAFRVLPRYPTGVFYLDTESTTKEPLTAVGAVTQLLVQVAGMWQDLPVEPSTRIALWRGLIADQASLILIDNYAGEFDLRQILPNGTNCAAIITSRCAVLGISPGMSCRLDVMDDCESGELAERVLGAVPLREIVTSSHGMPSVIRCTCDVIREVALGGPYEAGIPAPRVAGGITPLGGYRLREKIDNAIRSLDEDCRMFLAALSLIPAREYTYDLMSAVSVGTSEDTQRIVARLVCESFLLTRKPGIFALPHALYEYLCESRGELAEGGCRQLSLKNSRTKSRVYRQAAPPAGRATWDN
jgi:DNA-binding SARP family transcriptional activator